MSRSQEDCESIRQGVVQAIKELPELNQQIVICYIALELGFDQIAQLLNVTPDQIEATYLQTMLELSRKPDLQKFLENFKSVGDLLKYVSASRPFNEQEETDVLRSLHRLMGFEPDTPPKLIREAFPEGEDDRAQN